VLAGERLTRRVVLAFAVVCRAGRVAAAAALGARSAATASRIGAERAAVCPPSWQAPAPDEDGEDCPICLSAVGSDDAGTRLQCGHCYHADCIDAWLRQHATCPVCRSDQSTSAPTAGVLEAARLATQGLTRQELVELRAAARPAIEVQLVVLAVDLVLGGGRGRGRGTGTRGKGGAAGSPGGGSSSGRAAVAANKTILDPAAALAAGPSAALAGAYREGKLRLSDAGALLSQLLSFDPLSLPPGAVARLAPFVQLQALTPEALRGTSLAGSLLCRWFRAIYGCASQPESRAVLLKVREDAHAAAAARWLTVASAWGDGGRRPELEPEPEPDDQDYAATMSTSGAGGGGGAASGANGPVEFPGQGRKTGFRLAR
jgi:hypothetical protein